MRPVRTAVAGALLGVLLLAGCGRTTATPEPAGTTVVAGNGKVTLAKRPERIVSLSPTATETLYAIGAGAQVVAVDDQSTYPAEAPRTKLSGFKPNVEAIAAEKPDLVVLANDLEGVVAGLAKIGVPVLLEPAAVKLDDAYDQIADLGAATGHAAEAAQVTANIRNQLATLIASVPKARNLTYYHELDSTPYSVTSSTFLGQIYALFGLTNIADQAPDAAGGYPKLSAEFVAKADPDLIFLADTKCCAQSRETLAERPGWSGLSAIKNDHVIPLDDDLASRWGPRVITLATTIAHALPA